VSNSALSSEGLVNVGQHATRQLQGSGPGTPTLSQLLLEEDTRASPGTQALGYGADPTRLGLRTSTCSSWCSKADSAQPVLLH